MYHHQRLMKPILDGQQLNYHALLNTVYLHNSYWTKFVRKNNLVNLGKVIEKREILIELDYLNDHPDFI
jgi:hypothetical protein